MKILLLGEYSKLHNSLKAGLEQLGHRVHLVGTGDDFKNFPVDRSYRPVLTEHYWLFKFIRRVFYRLFKIDLRDTERGIRFYFLLPKLKAYDRVQLINSDAIRTHPKWNLKLLKKLFKQNDKISLLVCGDETPVTDYLLKRELKYSVLSTYFKHPERKSDFHYIFKYTQENYRRTFDFVQQKADVLITSDMDYKIPMDRMGYKNTLIPNPIIRPSRPSQLPDTSSKINIFLGINRLSYYKKGIPFFEKALAAIQERYADQVNIKIVENLPYETYIKTYRAAHIFLDMVYAYDQGYNALEAMAQGKVVFTGAETEFLQHYKLKEDEVCINALPEVSQLVKKLSWLIENPAKINDIGTSAQNFIRREHDYKKVAQRYVEVWNKEG